MIYILHFKCSYHFYTVYNFGIVCTTHEFLSIIVFELCAQINIVEYCTVYAIQKKVDRVVDKSQCEKSRVF